MQQTRAKKICGLILSGAALLQLVLLLSSMVASFFLPEEDGMRPQWSSYLIALILLAIAVAGIYQIRARRETPRSDIPAGLILGIVGGVLLMIPGLGVSLIWAAFGLPMLAGILLQGPGVVYTFPWLFALASAVFYSVFVIVYNVCYYRGIRRGGTINAGIWSCLLAVMATFPGASLTFSLGATIVSLVFHGASSVIGISAFTGVSPFMNALVSYQSIVGLIAIWLLTPVVLSLVIVLIRAGVRRRMALRPALA